MLKINKRWGFYALLIACLLLALIRYAFQMDVPRIFLTALIIAIAMFGDRDEILAILLGCIPLHNAIDFYTAILACALIYVLKNPKKKLVYI